jgi:hypothetical protein
VNPYLLDENCNDPAVNDVTAWLSATSIAAEPPAMLTQLQNLLELPVAFIDT